MTQNYLTGGIHVVTAKWRTGGLSHQGIVAPVVDTNQEDPIQQAVARPHDIG